MHDSLFDLPDGDGNSSGSDQSSGDFFELKLGQSAKDAVEDALWAARYSGGLTERLNLALTLEQRLIRDVRNDDYFAAELARSIDPRGNVRQILLRWIRESQR